MIEAAEADIISPAVAAEDPLALLGQIILLSKNRFRSLIIAALKSFNKSVCSCAIFSAALEGIQILLACFCSDAVRYESFHLSLEACADCFLSEFHTITELGVVFEQGVRPSRALALRVGCVRCGR